MTTFSELTGTANPFNNIDVGVTSIPTFADIDGDGDLDLIVGEISATLKYFQNTDTGYSEQTGSNNPFSGIDVSPVVNGYSAPTFADIDGDGDLDLVVGERDGALNYFQNTGSATNPVYSGQTGSNNPFDGINVSPVGAGYSAPTLADIDGDGDLDLIVGETSGTLKYFQNTGTAYSEQTGSNNPFNGIDVGERSTPTFADIGGDGDLDLIVGETSGTLNYFLNTPNRPPTAVNDAVSTNEDTILNGNVLAANPTTADSDPDGDSLTVAGATIGGNAITLGQATALGNGLLTVNSDGTFSFDPTNGTATLTDGYNYLAQGATAQVSFGYTISDGKGSTATATATITITGVNDAPIVASPIADQIATTSSPFSLNVSGNFTDVDASDVLSYSATGVPTGIRFNGSTGVFSGTAAAPGIYDITVTATDQLASIADTFELIVANNQATFKDDAIFLSALGVNTINALNGNDIVFGTAGNDTIHGNGGNDDLFGSGGNDKLFGGDGDDLLDGGAGSDEYTGGARADIFVITTGVGFDTIKDFAQGIDQIALGGGLSFNNLTTTFAKGKTQIAFGSDVMAELQGRYTLTVADFVTV